MTDYYKESDKGCCLLCDNAKEGCLCLACKCKKCEWYIPKPEGGGECGHIDLDNFMQRAQNKYKIKKPHSNQKSLSGYFLVKSEKEYFCYLERLQKRRSA